MSYHELQFVGKFWKAAEWEEKSAWKAASLIDPVMLEMSALGAVYGIISRRFAKGEPVTLDVIQPEISGAGYAEAFGWVVDSGPDTQNLEYHAEKVYESWRIRRSVELLRDGLSEAEGLLEKPDEARKVAGRLCLNLMDLYANDPSGQPQTRDELIDEQLKRIDAEQESGITVPWPKMQDACGPWMPGEVIGLTGFSGSGKSTVTANLAMQVARRGTPVIIFPTEMGTQWLTRAVCALCRFPQQLAEKGQFRHATAEQRTQFRMMLDDTRDWPWELINRRSVGPAEIIAAVRTLRRQWPNQTVLAIVDHMHRLDYGVEEGDKMAGPATKLLKNFAGDANVCFLCLYQPRKPEGGDGMIYQPIYANRIRGHSSVWNELDVHMSVYRTWGEKSPFGRTEWGDHAVDLKPDGSPKIARPFADDAVLNTEHTFMKPDKRRIGGEGPSFFLNIHKPSGAIFEQSKRALQAV